MNFPPHFSIASVDGKQHLSEIVFSALVGYSLLEKYPIFLRKLGGFQLSALALSDLETSYA